MADPTVPLWLTVLLSLLSGVAGSLITILYSSRNEKRRWRVSTFQRLVANRHAIAEGEVSDGVREEFFAALNEVFVVFHDLPAVVAAADKLQADMSRPERFHDNFVALFKAIARETGFSLSLNESFILRPFMPAMKTRGSGA